MRIQQIQTFNTYNNNSKNKSIKNPSFEGGLSEWIAKNYYERFYRSTFAKKFVEKTSSSKWNNMTTHMSVLGSTLISSMYVIRTLNNDKLDEKKRKTLAINDVLTWAISTLGMYLADAKLANWWEGVTTRFTANYLLDNKKARDAIDKNNWDPANLRAKMKELDIKNVRDLNLDVIKDPKLTTFIDGMGVLKSLFIFGMIYRYVVPVLVMKPANYIGRKLHEKHDAEQQKNAQVNDK